MTTYRSVHIKSYFTTTLIVLLSLCVQSAAAWNFRDSQTGLEAIADLELSYGARIRTEDVDQTLVSPAHGGSRLSYGRSGNLDDGNLNYKEGDLVSNMVRANGEVTLGWRNFGLFVRGYAFYDFENEDNDRERTPLGDEALDQVGSDYELLDAYMSLRFTAGEVPLQFRLGDQVVNWGESRFFPGTGIDVANPLNIPLAQQPTGTLRDLRKPVGMLWGSAHISPLLIVEAYYQYDWEPAVLPAAGTYFSTNDGITPDGNYIQAEGFGNQFGTDLTELYGLPAQTLEAVGIEPFDRNFYQITTRGPDDEPSDSGQFGISLEAIVPRLNDSEFGFHYASYNASLPSFGLVTPPVEDYIQYSEQAIGALERDLAREGVGPIKRSTVASLTQLSKVLKNVEYFAVYPDDIEMFAVTFNTTTLRTGTAFFAEVSHHLDSPVAVHSGDLLSTILPGSTRDDPLPPVDLTETTLKEIEEEYANKRVDAYETLDRTFALAGATQLFGPQLGASQTLLNVEIAYLYIHDAPDPDELYMPVSGLAVTDFGPESIFATEDSWGYRIGGGMVYNNVFGGVNLRPRVIFSHDVDGSSPVGSGPFLEDRKSFTVGLQAQYLTRMRVDVSYTAYSGAGQSNLINDRDNVNFSVRYDF
ncbi:DUF1302 domain-containing protein [Marinobacter alexandrii]|uniref:DUF1302 domain-containing protein n=1 Tax=Marinobacter alexandrii TaxID=2570351 RepID=UPI003297F7D7